MGSGSSTEAEREPLLVPSETNGEPVNGRVYGRRWLVLGLFSLLGLMQGMVWNFWGPIQNSALHAFGFTKSDIAVLVLWGPVGFVPWLLFMWLMDKKDEHQSVPKAFPVRTVQHLSWKHESLKVLMHDKQLLNGISLKTVEGTSPNQFLCIT